MNTSEAPPQVYAANQMKTDIRGFLGRFFPVAQLGDEEDIFQNGFINSLFAQQLILFLERHFKVEIPDQELERENFQSINAMAALAERLQNGRTSDASAINNNDH